MKLCVTTTDVIDREILRKMLIDAMGELTCGESKLLEPTLPWDGHPILVADAEHHPVLISFDPVNAQSALLNGLQAIERIATALPWINQVYDALHKQMHPPRLVVISHDPPPGTAALLANCPGLKLFSYKVLSVNGETGLLLEPVVMKDETSIGLGHHTSSPALAGSVEPASGPVAVPRLSEEEKTYFRQL